MSYVFPGMDPYLEHPGLWKGFHTKLITVIQELLMPLLPDRYWVDVEETVYVEIESRPPDTGVGGFASFRPLHLVAQTVG